MPPDPASRRPISIYVHVPFCARKCGYCDFNAYADAEALFDPYAECVVLEVQRSEARGRPAPTLYFGGGTPSYLPVEGLARIMGALRAGFRVAPDAEVSAEANPTSSDAGRFAAMRALGINRLSIGVQAFQRDLLTLLDRDHTPEQAEHAVAMARAAGFRNVSVDLMFALPGQTRAQWDETLTRALDLGTEHVSLYSLTLEPGTRLERLHAGGKIARAGEELDLWMYERAIERLTGAGFEHYEISNFARPGYRCRHNLVYWRNGEYAGFGPGAVSYIDSRRMTTEKRPALYVSKVRGGLDAVVECESLDWRSSLGETMMLGIRLLDGVPLGEVRARYGSEVDSVLAGPIERLEARGLVRCANDTIRLTRRGLLLADTVALEFLA